MLATLSSTVVIGVSIVLSMAAVDVGPALAADAPAPVVPATDTSVRYQVSKGDSLSSIARRNGVTVGALTTANHLTNPHLIVVGQWLVIPGAARRPPAAPTSHPARSRPRPLLAAPAGSPLVYVLRRGRQPQRGRPQVQGHRRGHRRGERHPQPEPGARRPQAHDPGAGPDGADRPAQRSTRPRPRRPWPDRRRSDTRRRPTSR